jgi:hypothetical protein
VIKPIDGCTIQTPAIVKLRESAGFVSRRVDAPPADRVDGHEHSSSLENRTSVGEPHDACAGERLSWVFKCSRRSARLIRDVTRTSASGQIGRLVTVQGNVHRGVEFTPDQLL